MKKQATRTICFLIAFALIAFSSAINIFAVADVDYVPFVWKSDHDALESIYIPSYRKESYEKYHTPLYWSSVYGLGAIREKVFDPDGILDDNDLRERILSDPYGLPCICYLIEYYGYTKDDFIKINNENCLPEIIGYADEAGIYRVDLSLRDSAAGKEKTLVKPFPDYFIDVLYSGDDELIRFVFKNPSALYDFGSGRLYLYYELAEMTGAELSAIVADKTDLEMWNVMMRCSVDYWGVFTTDNTDKDEECKRISSSVKIIDYSKETAPQTGTPIVPLAITAVAALILTAALKKRKI